ncbi:hypothetical protein, partial [Thiolapillus sp.]
TRSGIHRTLRRHGVSHLNALLRAENEEEAQPAKRKTFKDCNYSPLRLSTSLPRWIYNRFFMSVEA